MNRARLVAYTTLTMVAFAGNSLFCRMVLKETTIDAATFTAECKQGSDGCGNKRALIFHIKPPFHI
ncbi:MAG: hypothetical protein ACOY9D_09460 [Pseudomonadota bacterium]